MTDALVLKERPVSATGFDRPPLIVTRQGRFLAPASEMDAAELACFSPTAPIQVRVTQERHAGQHRLYFALLGKVADNMPGDVTAEELHAWVKDNVATEILDHATGELFRMAPASIAFEAMTQPQFHTFFRRVVDLLVTRILPGLDQAELTREASALLGFSS